MPSTVSTEDYLRANCQQSINWVAYYKVPQLLSGGDFENLHIMNIYFTHIFNSSSKKKMITLFCGGRPVPQAFYLFKHEVESSSLKSEDTSSGQPTESTGSRTISELCPPTIIKLKNIKDVVNHLSGNELKMIGIKYNKFIKTQDTSSNKETKEAIPQVNNGKLDLSYLMDITDDDMLTYTTGNGDYLFVDTLVLVQNFRLLEQQEKNEETYEEKWQKWLSRFISLKALTIAHMPSLTFNHEILKTKNIEIINIHECPRTDIRTLYTILKYSNAKEININNINLCCQFDKDNMYVKDEEWKSINNNSAKYISLNTQYLETDTIDSILKCVNCLEKFIMHDDSFEKCMKTMIQGSSSRFPLLLIKWSDIVKNTPSGVSVKWRPTFSGMYKSTRFTISESMAKIMDKKWTTC